MLELLTQYIGCSFAGLLLLLSGKLFFKNHQKLNCIKVIISILVVGLFTTIFNMYATDTMTDIIKIVLTYVLSCVYYYLIFKVSISKTVTAGFLTYLSIVVSDILFGIVMTTLEVVLNINPMTIYENKILVDFLVYGISFCIIKINEKNFIYLIENSNFNKKISTIMTVLIIITIALVGLKVPLSEWKFSLDFIVTMLTMLTFCIIGIYLIIQNSEIKKTTSMYQQLVEYSDITNGLLEDYRLVSHEHKNQLSIIRGMLDTKNKELISYVDDLLDKRNIIKYQWLAELNHLPLSGLKGLINYKMMESEKAKNNATISISKEISKTKLNKLTAKQKDNFYTIMGVYLDNAIQAAKDSKTKEISLEIYKEKQEIVVVLANTYKGKVELEKLDSYGYTTKGRNHGVGLTIVKRIIESDSTFTQKRYLFEDYYIQELHIDLKKIKSKKTGK